MPLIKSNTKIIVATISHPLGWLLPKEWKGRASREGEKLKLRCCYYGQLYGNSSKKKKMKTRTIVNPKHSTTGPRCTGNEINMSRR